MLPVNAVNIYSVQTPLINTAVPGSTITHVPYDNVAPSVSSAQIDPNARGNSNVTANAQTAAATVEVFDADSFQLPQNSNTRTLSPGAQATFLAQLIGQDAAISPETQGMLVQYEKLVEISNVKYKPSYAFKPSPAPSGVFGLILQQEGATAKAPAPLPSPVQSPVNAGGAASLATVASAPKLTVNAPARSRQNDHGDAPARIVPSPHAAGAYRASAARAAAAISTVEDLA